MSMWSVVTCWSLIEAAREATAKGRVALAELCKRHYRSVVRYLILRGETPDTARDVAHDFFVDLMSKPLPRRDDVHGSFGAYLRAALRHDLIDRARRDSRIKRGGDVDILSTDAHPGLLDYSSTQFEILFDEICVDDAFTIAYEELHALWSKRTETCDTLLQVLGGTLTRPQACEQLGIKQRSLETELSTIARDLKTILDQLASDYVAEGEGSMELARWEQLRRAKRARAARLERERES